MLLTTHYRRSWPLVAVAALSCIVFSSSCDGRTMWTEVGDAGNAPRPTGADAAQVTTGAGVLSSIRGVIADDTSIDDIDAFRIRIDDPDSFSAGLKSDPLTGIADGFLFLFDENGKAVVADNNSFGFMDIISEIPIGTLMGTLMGPGDYFIAISTGFSGPDFFDPSSSELNDGDLPVNEAGDLLFDLASDFLDLTLGAVGPSATATANMDTAFHHWAIN